MFPKNVQAQIYLYAVSGDDGRTPKTGLTVTTTISKDGGGFAPTTNVASEVGSGFYVLTLTATEMNADIILLVPSAPGQNALFDYTELRTEKDYTPTKAGYLDVATSSRAPASTAVSNADLTATRVAYLDKLNITGNVASSAEVTAIQNNTSTRIVMPDVFERPDTGSLVSQINLYIYNSVGEMVDPDSTPTITAENGLGVDRSANLTNGGVLTHISTGHYHIGYTVTSAHALEQLIFEFTVIVDAATRIAGMSVFVLDTSAVQFSSEDRSTLIAIDAKTTNLPAAPASAGAVAAIPTNPLLTTDSRLGNIDVATSSRLATASYVAPNNAGIAALPLLSDIEASTVLAKETTSASIEAVVTLIKKLLGNRAKLDDTTKTWIIYDDDETTPLATFQTFDKGGAPSVDAIYERVPA